MPALDAALAGGLPAQALAGTAKTKAQRDREALADRFDGLADTLARGIQHKRAPLTQNATPRRLRIKQGQRADADRMEATERALRGMAAALRADALPVVLVPVTTRKAVEEALHGFKRTPLRDRRREAMQALAAKDDAADAERRERERIEALEAEVRWQRIPGFFPTPPAVIAKMLAAADKARTNGTAGWTTVLEPSAGLGHIVEAVHEHHPAAEVTAVEVSHTLAEIMEGKGLPVIRGDFLALAAEAEDTLPGFPFDLVLMNPPFERGWDVEHITRAWDMVAPGGRLVALCAGGRSADTLRPWVEGEGGSIERLPEGSFTGPDSFKQTGVAACLIVIDKSED